MRRRLDFGVNVLLGLGVLLVACGLAVKYGLREGALGSLASSWDASQTAPVALSAARPSPAAAAQVVKAVENPKPTPAVAPQPAAVVAVAPKPAPAPAPAVGAKTIVYQDSFAKKGVLNGAKPDSGGAAWTSSTDPGDYILNGQSLEMKPAAYAYSSAFLPVNGTTGIVLDGSRDFTLSVVVTPGASGRTGISLNSGSMGSYSNIFSNPFAALSTSKGFAGAYVFGSGAIGYNYAPGIDQPTTVSIAYKTATKTVVYTVGATVVYTQTGVTPEQVASIRYVALGNDGYNGSAPPPMFSDFVFSVG
jgi:hypothetical protein